MPTFDSNRGAKRAREARAALGLDPTEALDCILTAVEARAKVPVGVSRMDEKVAGACWRLAGTGIIWVNGVQAVTRQRFTLAHELGHIRCGHDTALAVDDVSTLSDRTDPLEVQANAFAAEFLLPRQAVRESFASPPRLDELVDFAARYGVSPHVALFSLQPAGVADAQHTSRLRREIDDGEHKHLAAEPLDDRLERLEDLPYMSPALEGSALAGVMTGTITVAQAAQAAGIPLERFAPALEAFAR